MPFRCETMTVPLWLIRSIVIFGDPISDDCIRLYCNDCLGIYLKRVWYSLDDCSMTDTMPLMSVTDIVDIRGILCDHAWSPVSTLPFVGQSLLDDLIYLKYHYLMTVEVFSDYRVFLTHYWLLIPYDTIVLSMLSLCYLLEVATEISRDVDSVELLLRPVVVLIVRTCGKSAGICWLKYLFSGRYFIVCLTDWYIDTSIDWYVDWCIWYL